MDIPGIMKGFHTKNYSKTGRIGKILDIGKNEGFGMLKVTGLDRWNIRKN
jgi:hypothetical protein